MSRNRHSDRAATAARCVGALAFAVATSPAFAQVAKVSRTMELVVTILTTISVAVITAATIWVGFKVMWHHAKLAEVANVIWGAMLVGGAAGFAAMWYSA